MEGSAEAKVFFALSEQGWFCFHRRGRGSKKATVGGSLAEGFLEPTYHPAPPIFSSYYVVLKKKRFSDKGWLVGARLVGGLVGSLVGALSDGLSGKLVGIACRSRF